MGKMVLTFSFKLAPIQLVYCVKKVTFEIQKYCIYRTKMTMLE